VDNSKAVDDESIPDSCASSLCLGGNLFISSRESSRGFNA
jgi:hypothetical protein